MPSPKDHAHDVGVFVEVSLNATAAFIFEGFADTVKSATGAMFETLMNVVCAEMFEPYAFVAFRAADQFPAPNVSVGFWRVLK